MGPDGNVYVTGDFSGTVNFDPGPNTHDLTSVGGSDAFVLKLDPAGNFDWAQSFGGTSPGVVGGWGTSPPSPGGDSTDQITVAPDGSVYTLGTFAGKGNVSVTTINPVLAAFDVPGTYLTKLDKSGNFVWTLQAPGTTDIAAGSDNDIYATGATTFKLDASGNLIWNQNIAAQAIALAGDGSVFVGTSPTPSLITSTVTKLDSNGDNLGSVTFDGLASSTDAADYGYDLAVGSDGSLYLANHSVQVTQSGTDANITYTYQDVISLCKVNADGASDLERGDERTVYRFQPHSSQRRSRGRRRYCRGG